MMVDLTIADVSGNDIISVFACYVKPVEHVIGVLERCDPTGEGYFDCTSV